MEDERLAEDEARRIAQHGAAAGSIGREIKAEIAERAANQGPDESGKLNQLANEMRGNAIDEVSGTSRELGRARAFACLSQVLDYLFSLLYGLLVIRLVLVFVAARSGNAFVQLIQSVTDPFFTMFRGIVASPSAGGFTLALPILIALVVYALLHGAIKGFLRLIVHRQSAV
jgi:uncharacterized protein YggT (Ycf19 family)